MAYITENCYFLVVKNGKNSYLPLDWTSTKYYNNENLYTLPGIDSFTSKITRYDLLKEIMDQNLIDGDDIFLSFEILFYEKGKNRIIKEGPIFEEDEVLNEELLIEYIINNMSNKELINNILMQTNSIKEEDSTLEEFRNILKNISYYENKESLLRADLQIFKYISYEYKRIISIKVSNKILKKEQNKELKYINETN